MAGVANFRLRFPLGAAGGAAGLLMLKELATTAAENCAARGEYDIEKEPSQWSSVFMKEFLSSFQVV